MKKLSLKLDELRVEAFETAEAGDAERGTVKGNHHTLSCPPDTCGGSCDRMWTHDGTCDQTCGQPATCGYGWCGTYPFDGCPNSEWYCTDCQYVC